MTQQPHDARPDDSAERLNALLGRVRAGDQDAATALFTKYALIVRSMVRVRMKLLDPNLEARLRSRLDSADVSQDVWLTFFGPGIRDSENFRDKAAFMTFIAGIVRNKLREATRHHFDAAKRDPRREVPLDRAEGAA